jgi:acetyl esterase/lipase
VAVSTLCRCLVAAAFAASLLPSSAQAAPLPVNLSAPLDVSTTPGWSLGASAMTVTFTDTSATAVASAPAVTLPKGSVFRIDVCVQTHVYGGGNVTGCAQKTVDMTGKKIYAIVPGPTYTATTKRPSSSAAWGYAYHQVEVMRKGTDGKFTYFAGTSSTGLSGGAVSIPPVGKTPLPLPGQQGVDYTGVGGMNTGNPDSMCMSLVMSDSTPAGVSTTALGSGAPAYYEVGQPTGEFAGKAPKGVILLIHGGGWFGNGAGAVATMRDDADRWRARGWRTLNLTHRPCERAFSDVKWFYDRARELWGTGIPYCATGESAGGNMALSLAASRDSLSCVVDKSGPTDALSITDQRAYAPATGGTQDSGPRWIYNLMTAAFGEEQLRWYSPAVFPIKARVLAAFSERDPFVPVEQATELRDKMLARDANSYVDVDVLGPGTDTAEKFAGHAWVSQAALDDFYKREEQLVAPLVGG